MIFAKSYIAAIKERIFNRALLDVIVLDAVIMNIGKPCISDNPAISIVRWPDTIFNVINTNTVDDVGAIVKPNACVVYIVHCRPRRSERIVSLHSTTQEAGARTAGIIDRVETAVATVARKKCNPAGIYRGICWNGIIVWSFE